MQEDGEVGLVQERDPWWTDYFSWYLSYFDRLYLNTLFSSGFLDPVLCHLDFHDDYLVQSLQETPERASCIRHKGLLPHGENIDTCLPQLLLLPSSSSGHGVVFSVVSMYAAEGASHLGLL